VVKQEVPCAGCALPIARRGVVIVEDVHALRPLTRLMHVECLVMWTRDGAPPAAGEVGR
jgi:hypothetical protein